MSGILLSVVIAIFFFLVVPGAGAFVVRAKWRRYRTLVYRAASRPRALYSDIRAVREGKRPSFECSFTGRLEALQGDSTLWLRDGSSSVEIDMENAHIVILPPFQNRDVSLPPRTGLDFPNETPEVIPWHRVTSLTEGSNVFVAGELVHTSGNAVFSQNTGTELLVLFFDGPPEHVLERAVWTGRQRNEYWSPVTPVALLSGMFALSIFAMQLLSQSRSDALLTLGLAMVPVLPLLPPAVPGYFLYRRLWRRGRAYRAARDAFRLEAAKSGDTAGAHDTVIRSNQRRAVWHELLAVSSLLASIFLNYVILVRLFAIIL